MSEEHDAGAAIVGNFELTAVLTDKRQLRMTGYVYSDDDNDRVNARIDSYMDVLDRQFVRADLIVKEAEITSLDANLAALVQHNEALINLQKTGKLTSQQKQQMTQFESSVRFHQQQKESKLAAIAAGKKKLNGASHG